MTAVTVFVTDTETVDKECLTPEDVCELGVVPVRVPNVEEPCEATIDRDGYFGQLVKPARQIRFGAMGVHHVTEEMVADAPSLVDALKICPFGDLQAPPVLAAHNAQFDAQFLREGLRSLPWHGEATEPYWVDTWRVARHVLPGMESYANQALRYQLQLRDRDLPAGGGHRALNDALLTSLLLVRILRERSLREICRIQHEPIIMESYGFGKHRGQLLTEVPEDYLRWVRDRSDLGKDEKHSARLELERRRGSVQGSLVA